MIPLFLSGCARKEEGKLEHFRQGMDARQVSFTLKVTSLEAENALTYTAEVIGGEEETAVSVTAPETIAGITFRQGENDILAYDGAVLVLTPAESGASPAHAAPLFARALRHGRCLYFGRSREESFVVLAIEDDITVTVYFDREYTCPLCAEIAEDGIPVLSLVIDRWQIKE